MYKKLSGMTGTAETEAPEFHKIYKLEVVAIPTNKPLIRLEAPDVVYRTEREKFEAAVNGIIQEDGWRWLSARHSTVLLRANICKLPIFAPAPPWSLQAWLLRAKLLIDRVYHIDSSYERIEEKLNKVGS